MCTRGVSPFESQFLKLMKDCSRLSHREPQKSQTLLNPNSEACQQLQPVLCTLALQPPSSPGQLHRGTSRKQKSLQQQ